MGGSENWETFSDASELEPERYDHYKGVHAANGMRVIGTHVYGHGHMAPPPKKRMHERIEEGDENSTAIVMADREPSWTTETEETY